MRIEIGTFLINAAIMMFAGGRADYEVGCHITLNVNGRLARVTFTH